MNTGIFNTVDRLSNDYVCEISQAKRAHFMIQFTQSLKKKQKYMYSLRDGGSKVVRESEAHRGMLELVDTTIYFIMALLFKWEFMFNFIMGAGCGDTCF